MSGFTVSVDDSKAKLKFAVLPDATRSALFTASQGLEQALLFRARELASGGAVNVRSGAYLRSIRGTTRQGKNSVTATTRSNSPLAAIIEHGAQIGAHDILPDTAQALHFGGSAGEVFAAIVHHPAVTLPARPVIEGAFDEMRDDIVSTLEDTARAAAKETFDA